MCIQTFFILCNQMGSVEMLLKKKNRMCSVIVVSKRWNVYLKVVIIYREINIKNKETSEIIL